MRMKATVSGSFHRHMSGIYDAVGTLRESGVEVLSPSDPRVVDCIGEFLFVASDRLRSISLVQDRHNEAIRHSDFLWVVCPDGYTGPSTCMEIGVARSCGVPVFSDRRPLDITIGEYVTTVSGLREAMREAAARRSRSARKKGRPALLLDPAHAISTGIGELEQLGDLLDARIGNGSTDAERAVARVADLMTETFGTK